MEVRKCEKKQREETKEQWNNGGERKEGKRKQRGYKRNLGKGKLHIEIYRKEERDILDNIRK